MKVIPGDASTGITQLSLLQHLDLKRIGLKKKKKVIKMLKTFTRLSGTYIREAGEAVQKTPCCARRPSTACLLPRTSSKCWLWAQLWSLFPK